jgi:hypothetical protein
MQLSKCHSTVAHTVLPIASCVSSWGVVQHRWKGVHAAVSSVVWMWTVCLDTGWCYGVWCVWGVVFWGLPSHVYISVVACDLQGTPVSQTSSPPIGAASFDSINMRRVCLYIVTKAPPSTHQCGSSMLKATGATGCSCGKAWLLCKSCCCMCECTAQLEQMHSAMHAARCVWRGVLLWDNTLV